MANPSNGTGKTRSASASTSSPKQRLATSFAPRPLTASEIDWLRREGREFQDGYDQIKADALRARLGRPSVSSGRRRNG